MAGQTVPGALPYPDRGDIPDAATWIQKLAEATDQQSVGDRATAAAESLALRADLTQAKADLVAAKAARDANAAEIKFRDDHGPHHFLVSVHVPAGDYPPQTRWYVQLDNLTRSATATTGGSRTVPLGYVPYMQISTVGGSGGAPAMTVTNWSNKMNGVLLVWSTNFRLNLTGANYTTGRNYWVWITASNPAIRGGTNHAAAPAFAAIDPTPTGVEEHTLTAVKNADGDYEATV
jgi:hypothetical protein